MGSNTFIVVILIIVFIILIILSTGALRIKAGARLRERRFIWDYNDGEYKSYNEFETLQRQGKISPVAKWKDYVERRKFMIDGGPQWKSFEELKAMELAELWDKHYTDRSMVPMRGPVDKYKWALTEGRSRPYILDKKQYYALFPGKDHKILVKEWNSFVPLTPDELKRHGKEAKPSPVSSSIRRAKRRVTRLKHVDLHHPGSPGHPLVRDLTRGEIQLPDAELRWKDWRQQLRMDGITTDELADLMKVDFKEEDFVISTDLSGPWKQCCHHIEKIRSETAALGIERYFLPVILFYPFERYDNFTVSWNNWMSATGYRNLELIPLVLQFYDSEYFRLCVGEFVSQTIMLDTFMKDNIDEIYQLRLEIRSTRLGTTVYTLHADETLPVLTTVDNRPTVQIDSPYSIYSESLLFIIVDGKTPPAVLTGYPNYGGPFDQLPRELRIKLLDDYKRMMDMLTPGECAVLFLNNKTVQHETPEPFFKNILTANKDLYDVFFPSDAKGITRWMFNRIVPAKYMEFSNETPIDIGIDADAQGKITTIRRDKPYPIYPIPGPPLTRSTTQGKVAKYKNGETVSYFDLPWEVVETFKIPDGSDIIYLLSHQQRDKFVTEDTLEKARYTRMKPRIKEIVYEEEVPQIEYVEEVVYDQKTNFTGYIRRMHGDDVGVIAWNRPELKIIPNSRLVRGRVPAEESFDDTLLPYLKGPNIIRFNSKDERLIDKVPTNESLLITLLEGEPSRFEISNLKGKRLTQLSYDEMKKFRNSIEVRRMGEDFLTIKDK